MPHEVIMPALGMAQQTGLIVSWLKQPGERVKVGDALMEVETDKTVMEVEAQAEGFLTDVRASAGDNVPVGHVIALISERADEPLATSASGSAPRSTQEKPSIVPAGESDAGAKGVALVAPRVTTERRPAGNAVEDRSRFLPAGSEPASGQRRILASPKMRRLAAEAGLDLSKLVAAGIPQPYHTRDLDKLRELSAPVLAASPAAAIARHLTARVSGSGFVDLCEWIAAETGTRPDPKLVLAGMAAAAARQGRWDQPIIVAAEAFGQRSLYIDPDQAGFGRAADASADAPPTLILRDLRVTAVTAVTMGAEAAPVLNVMSDGTGLLITLECSPAQLTPAVALEWISGFAGRLSEPLRHLL